MKNKRQNKILEIVSQTNVETQEELMGFLHAEGHRVTQATVSRDIKELRLAKIPNGKGGYKYSVPTNITKGDLIRRATRIFEDYVRSIDFSGSLIMIKTYPGGANAVAAVIDELQWPEMIGSIAGDDSILIVTRSEGEGTLSEPTGPTGEVYARIREIMEG
ncbi:MAG: arginine repressor [Firmicutes bacterium]|nr:arginine repressor [Bacillota bacterium]